MDIFKAFGTPNHELLLKNFNLMVLIKTSLLLKAILLADNKGLNARELLQCITWLRLGRFFLIFLLTICLSVVKNQTYVTTLMKIHFILGSKIQIMSLLS